MLFWRGILRPSQAFEPNARGRFMADLRMLARRRLQELGVSRIYGGDDCTFAQPIATTRIGATALPGGRPR